MEEQKCLFCKIATKEVPAYVINENDTHMAFLDVFPLVEGQAVVMPKTHRGGYAFDMPEDELKELMAFTQKTAKKIDSALGAERCMQVLQGYAIDHVHTKLFPVIRVKDKVVSEDNYRSLISMLKPNWYNGFIISMSGKERADDGKLKELVEKICGSDR